MTNEKFERLLSTIRNEHVDDKIVDQAERPRVGTAITSDSPSTLGWISRTLRSCDDFQSLIPCLPRKPNG
jgi:hypothetical protein